MNNPEAKEPMIAFRHKTIRRLLYKGEWWFSVVDIVAALTDSTIPRRYWSDLKKKIIGEQGGDQLYAQIVQLKIPSADGKLYESDCANVETLFRIIQSIPSPKAEPFKRWLARVGYERVQEIEDPELATKRSRALYKAKGHSDDWIEKRMRSIAVREELTDEWKKRGVEREREYAILTAEISKAAFGLTPSEHKKFKNLKRENLRDHMTDLELIFSMLGEASTTEITRVRKARDFVESRRAARDGGRVAGQAREKLEKETGRRVISRQNYLPPSEKKKTISKGKNKGKIK